MCGISVKYMLLQVFCMYSIENGVVCRRLPSSVKFNNYVTVAVALFRRGALCCASLLVRSGSGPGWMCGDLTISHVALKIFTFVTSISTNHLGAALFDCLVFFFQKIEIFS